MAVTFYREGQSEGALFVNKKTNPKSPDRTGSIKLTPEDVAALQRQVKEDGGAVLRVAAWLKKGRDGQTFLALNPEAEYRRSEKLKAQQNVEQEVMDDLDDDIPF